MTAAGKIGPRQPGRSSRPLWNAQQGHFWTGAKADGQEINQAVVPLDVQCWALLALGSSPEYRRALAWVEGNCQVEADGFRGFAFQSVKGKPDADLARGVWSEGTAQVCCAYSQVGEAAAAQRWLTELRRVQKSAKDADGRGLVAASRDGLDTGFGWKYYARPHLGATAWFIFAERGFNPYWQTVSSPGAAR